MALLTRSRQCRKTTRGRDFVGNGSANEFDLEDLVSLARPWRTSACFAVVYPGSRHPAPAEGIEALAPRLLTVEATFLPGSVP